ncbi:transketolase [Thermochromatium tepidum]|uniref:Transketolase n=1 Tax=Thermochromatium tepidum ATCC 43061 TaxID=316276 RepID=A0A6I6E248_THETI|nr:transketolase [Thermochromatium tepidum]QGU31752.1 transketolase [Thermochromatium tepidum ATCC 43061]
MSSRRELANAIRALAMDAVQKANSGHPGAPMGMADIAEVLWNDFMRHNPNNPKWVDRDRFVLSNGHGSMLIYALLHLTGYDLSLEDLKQFRQLHSKTPGHPEYGYTPGVETTTGPLGQGITNAVGMAIAEKVLAAQFNRPGHTIVDHYTYVFLGDGCLMEGLSHEACSLAGALGLGKLIAIYDDNNISIDGEVRGHGDTPGWFLDDTPKRFEAYGWHVIPKVDGHNPEAIKSAIAEARAVTDKPSLICCQTIIGYGAPNKQGKEECHGAALGEDEVALTRENLGWPHAPFVIPEGIYQGWDARERGAAAEADWNARFEAYAKDYPAEAAEFRRRMAGALPADWSEKADAFIKSVAEKGESIASRKASQNALNGFGPLLPELIGGSADLAGSNLTLWKGCKGVSKTGGGNYIYYGVREFGMSAIMNGIALHGGFIPYGGTFLMFSDYARNALRMAALMKVPSIFVYTHDSIGLGEDGPTHQPIEQLPTLRMIPNMSVWRPCDAVESAVAWKLAIERKGTPTCLIFSRQNLAHMPRTEQQIADIARGGYILRDCAGTPDAIIIATGSEVELAMKAAEAMSDKAIRVVSMPSTDTFDKQDAAYKESVLPKAVTARVAVEAAATDGWWKYVGSSGAVLGVDRFGESAPAGALFKEFGFTVENLVATVRGVL